MRIGRYLVKMCTKVCCSSVFFRATLCLEVVFAGATLCLEEIIEVVQSLTDFPDGNPDAERLGQSQPLTHRPQGRVVDKVVTFTTSETTTKLTRSYQALLKAKYCPRGKVSKNKIMSKRTRSLSNASL